MIPDQTPGFLVSFIATFYPGRLVPGHHLSSSQLNPFWPLHDKAHTFTTAHHILLPFSIPYFTSLWAIEVGLESLILLGMRDSNPLGPHVYLSLYLQIMVLGAGKDTFHSRVRQEGLEIIGSGLQLLSVRSWECHFKKRSNGQERKVKAHSEVGAKENQIQPGIPSDHRGRSAGWYRFDRTGYSSVE